MGNQDVAQRNTQRNEKQSLWNDIKLLFKGLVLVLNVMPVFVGFWLAMQLTGASIVTEWVNLIIVLVGSTFVMAGALALNNWYEVDLDTAMLRTQQRPTVTGRMSLKAVLAIGISLSLIGFVIMLFTTLEAAMYAFIGWLAYVVLYTFWSKRRYTLNTIIGSISGAVTPLIGWAVLASTYDIVPIVLFLILFIWQIPHTFAIAMKRSEEYRAAGVPMLPVVAGFAVAKRQIFIYIACLLPFPFLLYELGLPFIIVATVLNIGWLVISIKGLKGQKDDVQWAHSIFIYSLAYLTILFLLMVISVTF